MNALFHQMRGWLDHVVTRVNAVVDPPLPAGARPLEVQGAVVDDVEQRAEPIGRGRRVLPHHQVVVTVLAPDEEDRAALQAALVGLQDAVCNRLREIRCDVPAGFDVSVQYATLPPPGWTPEQRLAVGYSSRGTTGTTGDHTADQPKPPTLRVTVVRGRTTEPAYALTESRVYIGRTAAPVDGSGRTRQNHVVFLEEGGDAHSGTVGRAHATVHYRPERRGYQLFDDGSRNGTRVVRNGVTLDVVRRDPVGITLQSGDEIQFGTAAVRVDIDGRTPT